MIKTISEIKLIKMAAEINIKTMEYVKMCYNSGMKDYQLQIEIESYARSVLSHPGIFWTRGANMDATISLVVTGKTSMVPTYTDFVIGGRGLSPFIAQGASGEILGDSFVVDFVGVSHGYLADSTRTFFTSPPPEKIVRIYNELITVKNQLVDFIYNGVTANDSYNFIDALVSEYEWGNWFMGLDQKVKFVGHGLGIEINQLPVIAPKQYQTFEENMVIAIEPKIFVPDYGIIGIEDTYLLEDNKLHSLTGNPDNIDDFVI